MNVTAIVIVMAVGGDAIGQTPQTHLAIEAGLGPQTVRND